jgi:hypothetical protein
LNVDSELVDPDVRMCRSIHHARTHARTHAHARAMLMPAVAHGKLDVVQTLIAYQADTDARDAVGHHSLPLSHFLSACMHEDTLKRMPNPLCDSV